jgi:hypothetical protein
MGKISGKKVFQTQVILHILEKPCISGIKKIHKLSQNK